MNYSLDFCEHCWGWDIESPWCGIDDIALFECLDLSIFLDFKKEADHVA